MTGRSASSGICSKQLDAVGARQHQIQQHQLGAGVSGGGRPVPRGSPVTSGAKPAAASASRT